MKVLNKKIAVALFFMFTLLLPMGISVVHAFHQHESNICLAIDESHFHSDDTECDQLHYFSQTVEVGFPTFNIFSKANFQNLNQLQIELEITNSIPLADPVRGPPVITVF